MNKITVTLASSILIITIVVLVVLLAINQRPDLQKAGNENTDTANDKKAPQAQSQTSSSETTPSKVKANPDNDKQRLPENQGLSESPATGIRPVAAELDEIPPGKRIQYAVTLSVTGQNEDSRDWNGTVMLRSESRWSTTTVNRKRLDQATRPAKDYRLVARQFGTGLAIPRRWVLVGNQFVEGAEKVTVYIDDQPVQAEVRTRLKKSGFAVLQLPDGNFPKISIPESKRINKPTNVAWLDSSGKLQVATDLRYDSYSSGSGGKYSSRQKLTDNNIGGVTFDNAGNISGLIVDTIHPTIKINSYSLIYPMSRIAKTWNPANQKIIFAPAKTDESKDAVDLVSKKLVRVLVERTPQADSPFLFYVSTDISAPKSASGRKVEFHDPATGIKEDSLYAFRDGQVEVLRGHTGAKQLPFYLGNVLEHLLIVFSRRENIPIHISATGYRHCVASESNGRIRFSNSELAMNDENLSGTRQIELVGFTQNDSGLQSAPGLIELTATQRFDLSKSDFLPNHAELTGMIHLGDAAAKQSFELKLEIKRL